MASIDGEHEKNVSAAVQSMEKSSGLVSGYDLLSLQISPFDSLRKDARRRSVFNGHGFQPCRKTSKIM